MPLLIHRVRDGNLDKPFGAGICRTIYWGVILLYRERTKAGDEASVSRDTGEAEDIFDHFGDFCDLHGYTPRERDVMNLLLRSDESMKNISVALGISERMLYRYMNSLYEKTGTENRAGLVKKYYEERSAGNGSIGS